jgi:hypothetical protein
MVPSDRAAARILRFRRPLSWGQTMDVIGFAGKASLPRPRHG